MEGATVIWDRLSAGELAGLFFAFEFQPEKARVESDLYTYLATSLDSRPGAGISAVHALGTVQQSLIV